MKPNGYSMRTPTLIKIFLLVISSVAFFYLGKRWSDSTDNSYSFFLFGANSRSRQTETSVVAISPNANNAFNLSLLPTLSPPPQISPPLLPVEATPERVGILDGNGTMAEDFSVGEIDSDLEEKSDEGEGNVTREEWGDDGKESVRIGRFRLCQENMREYIPCLDNDEEIAKLKSKQRGEKYERHCPGEEKSLNCLVPAPKGYKPPIRWPKSREEVWFSNVPHTRLVDDKGGQNWIKQENDKFTFPGGGTQFIHGADQYLDQISEMIPDIAFGHHTRVALDIGCGVASFGAFLLARNVTTMSIAPKDVHENQIQFALERGVPAMVAAFATHRLPYPSQAFDLIHCSRCRINWTRDDGLLLLELNRMLRAGGYFAWAAQPVYKHEEAQQEAWTEMENLTSRICWELVKKEGYIAIWRKPLNNSCYVNRDAGVKPPLCDLVDNPDSVWYIGLKPCISRLPENGDGTINTAWPDRLDNPPERLKGVEMDAYISKKELFKAESNYWNSIIKGYNRVFHWENMQLRNVMDMKAGFGGFAAALIKQNLDSWVMNVVPTSESNTLPIIYDRGLIGVAHDWCESFDTYPRTYDLLHAANLFSTEKKRCNITNIFLEMDRILRPGGRAYIIDSESIMVEINEITKAMGWRSDLRDTSEGPYSRTKLLRCEKLLKS
ncbi:S-adenosyl-L-methionine-dependent methyltransferases superfamilyprotein [Zostera marina]|uniref:Methyltransferase n=1 Tax=Zostera marina TaxID=29655 RepID=A0A0K9Q116_ZOSMR|nr:S-adenosyl-L-methionine-dependent methyltransferases superfamilyprotein [Zostera marina]